MRAVVVAAQGRQWELREVPTPEPGPNQVVIKVRAYERVAEGKVRFRAVVTN